ncbi:hypothetical protein ABFX02_07G031400 [Erythranthe guttata]
MEGSVRSGGVLKKKSSSGCLIIKKKVDNRNSGVGVSSVNITEKKRPRLAASDDSSASDEDESLEFMRRKVNDSRLHNGSMGYRRSEIENSEYDMNNVGLDISGERKRSKVESFEFDEYDEFDRKRVRNEYEEGRFKMVEHMGGENAKEFVTGSSRRNWMVDKRKQSSYIHGSSSGRIKGGEHGGLRNKGFELEDDESQLPISLVRLKYEETAKEPIRVQGKNGVLKVMVNKKKGMDLHSHHKKYDRREVDERAGSRSEDVLKNLSPPLPVYRASKALENRALLVDKEKTIERKKIEVKLEKVKPVLSKGIKAIESESDGTDTALKLAPPGLRVCSSKKVVKMEEERAPSENVTPVVKVKDEKEGKAKRGGSTEKQILREKIRGMLIDAGWTIDYRPRRNRDYLDAVYINPNGTAYWSIIKAYDALKKQLDEDSAKRKLDVGSPSFAPLSEDLINKLTRQTKKKIEQEMKRKRKEEGTTKSAKRSAVRDGGESSDSDQNEERLSSYKKDNCKSQRSKLLEVDRERSDDDVSDDSPERSLRKVKVGKPCIASSANVLQGRTSKVIGRCTLLVRGSDGYVSYSGKRTVLGWLIDSGTAQLSEKVQYMNRKRHRVMLEGWITSDGIHCGCCSKILTVSKFEVHAGSKLRQPFRNIFLESGASLLQCQIDAWNSQGESARRIFHAVDVNGDDPDDDTCGICGDGGALICCDSCPSTFHQICLEIQMLPSGDWHCPNCICKFCGDASENASETDTSGDELTKCSFCEKRYHKSCSQRMYALPTSSNASSFCGIKCEELFDHLQKILGVKHELEAGFSWSFIQQTDVSDTLHPLFPQRVECNSKLAVALSVMDECFLPIIDRRSGINMIRNVLYNCGSNFNRLNYSGFYTAILERGDEIVSAASIRIHGTRLAEMPFIGTRELYRRQGMCRRLLSAIETELRSLNVEHLIIPAISEHMNTWTTIFGFHRLHNVLKKEMRSMNMLVFPGTDMLQKRLMEQESSDGMKVSESTENQDQPRLPVLVEKTDVDSSNEHDNKQTSDSSGFCHNSKPNSKVNGLGLINNPAATIASDSVCKSDIILAVEAVTGNTRKIESPCLKSTRDSYGKTPVAAEGIGKLNNPLSLDSAEIVNNGEHIASFSTRVVEDQPREPTTKSELLEASIDSAATSDENDKHGVESKVPLVIDEKVASRVFSSEDTESTDKNSG